MQHFSRLVKLGERRQIVRGEHGLVSDIQPTHHNIQPALEDFRGSLGIDSNIKLGVGCEVPAPGRAAHNHQTVNVEYAFRIMGQQQRNVGQRANCHQRHGLRGMHQRIANRLEGGFCHRLAVVFDKFIPFHTGLTMHGSGITQRPHQRHRCSLRQWNIRIPEVQQLQRITGGFFHRHIACYRGHQLQIQLRGKQRGGNGGGIINAGIGIKNDR